MQAPNIDHTQSRPEVKNSDIYQIMGWSRDDSDTDEYFDLEAERIKIASSIFSSCYVIYRQNSGTALCDGYVIQSPIIYIKETDDIYVEETYDIWEAKQFIGDKDPNLDYPTLLSHYRLVTGKEWNFKIIK